MVKFSDYATSAAQASKFFADNHYLIVEEFKLLKDQEAIAILQTDPQLIVSPPHIMEVAADSSVVDDAMEGLCASFDSATFASAPLALQPAETSTFDLQPSAAAGCGSESDDDGGEICIYITVGNEEMAEFVDYDELISGFLSRFEDGKFVSHTVLFEGVEITRMWVEEL